MGYLETVPTLRSGTEGFYAQQLRFSSH